MQSLLILAACLGECTEVPLSISRSTVKIGLPCDFDLVVVLDGHN